MKKLFFRTILVIVGILLIGLIGFVFWALTPPQPLETATIALAQPIATETDDYLLFEPEDSAEIGLIFYPGGRVDARSYAPIGYQLAQEGYVVVIPFVTLNLAVFESNAAAPIMAAHPEIETWVVGGHSLGGAMAATFLQNNLDDVAGLVLWASRPAGDLSTTDVDVLSVFGSEDGLMTLEDIDSSKLMLPSDTQYFEITGGNHAQFGDYGEQNNDLAATISRSEQQQQAVGVTANFLASIQEVALDR